MNDTGLSCYIVENKRVKKVCDRTPLITTAEAYLKK